ncbi:23S rRNA (uracil(1939)-C(5))-methyltransferase RlmD [Aliifodinibius sp. S!AR15-10]|uniref:23S rRNA (uracil(1939)-C(5))-methyltransferase RlmD n=1 Tax=Aliifodinibius sp. S!AR15-10 TaxID=2950437 RepID=UPI00285DC11C|nr:23S rRNA (uracil(1939)-C(5))-methyltransferase RlmD [Aliifodinibius sp. S!AR15-10]MDR8392585.1 23S rRNA (uracil(1939)-C(5))-methyltransferase RlmD [Aliifodinibius sp. S!AR15-10]
MKLKKGADVELKIESTAFKGKGIAKLNGLAIFVPNTAPGDRVEARIIKKKKNHAEAKLLKVLEGGPKRIEPRCGHAKMCGGCSWQHVDYASQLEFKQSQVQDHMERIGGFKELEVEPTIGCEQPFYYRNKMEYSIGHKKWLSREEIERDEYVSDRCFAAGLHAPGRFDKILNLNECHLQEPISYEILDFIRSYCTENDISPFNRIDNEGFMRNVVVRNSYHTDDLMVNIVTYKDDQETMQKMSNALLDKFPQITTIINNVNDTKSPTAVGRYEKVLHGPGYIVDSIGGYNFNIDANAFFQTNTGQAERLYEVARSFADLQPDDLLYDLYCGVGTLSLFMSEKAEKVIGIENVDVAIENARANAKSNGVENVEFVKGDMKDVFNQSIVAEHGKPDCIITDPPRSGMHPDVVEYLKHLEVPKLVYVSCNSSTMARDLKELNKVYDILEVQPVDMFPQTYHIETVANLRLR